MRYLGVNVDTQEICEDGLCRLLCKADLALRHPRRRVRPVRAMDLWRRPGHIDLI